MPGIFPPAEKGVPHAPTTCNSYGPIHPVVGGDGPWFAGPDCSTPLDECMYNAVISEILAAIDLLGHSYDPSRVDNLGLALRSLKELIDGVRTEPSPPDRAIQFNDNGEFAGDIGLRHLTGAPPIWSGNPYTRQTTLSLGDSAAGVLGSFVVNASTIHEMSYRTHPAGLGEFVVDLTFGGVSSPNLAFLSWTNVRQSLFVKGPLPAPGTVIGPYDIGVAFGRTIGFYMDVSYGAMCGLQGVHILDGPITYFFPEVYSGQEGPQGGTATPRMFGIRESWVNDLPTPVAALAGVRATVADATTTTFGAPVVGGGSHVMPVFCNGNQWLIG